MTEPALATSDRSAYTETGLTPPKYFRVNRDGRPTPSAKPETRVDKIWNAKAGRPSTDETRARTSQFLCLMADGLTAEQAAREARIGPWRALRIVTETDFLGIVQAIRDGAGPVAVQVAERPGSIAA